MAEASAEKLPPAVLRSRLRKGGQERHELLRSTHLCAQRAQSTLYEHT